LGTGANKGIGVGVATAANVPTFNAIRILKGTDPVVGYTDSATIYTASATESLAVTMDNGIGNLVVGTVNAKRLVMADAGALTCATDAVTVTGSYHTIIGEGGLADDLVTINGGVDGAELAIQADSDSVTITVKSTGNIVLGTDVALATSSDYLLLKYSAALTKWVKVSAVVY
jgi:hypothetical protein